MEVLQSSVDKQIIQLQTTDLINYLNYYNNDMDVIIQSIFNDFDYNSSKLEFIEIQGCNTNKQGIIFEYDAKLFQELCRYLFFFEKIVINYGSLLIEFHRNI